MRRIIVLILGILLFVTGGMRADAQQPSCTNANSAGRLDCGFASTGFKLAQVTPSRDNPHALVVQPDGKILIAGTVYDYGITTATGKDFGLVRLNPDGSFDTTFDGDGIVIAHSTDSHHDEAFAMALQPDGKIIVGGIGGGVSFFLTRHNANGSLDTTFGFNNGKVLGPVAGTVRSLAVQPDGKIIAMGGRTIVRYNTDGTADTTFDGDGIVAVAGDGAFYATRLQADGKIVIAGSGTAGQVMRFNPNGSLDTSFGTGGAARVLFPDGGSIGYALVIEPDGNIVVAGETHFNTPFNICKSIFRFTSAGVSTEKNATCSTTGGSGFYALAQQSDGKLIGVGRDNINGSDLVAAVRYKRSLEPEISFNDGAGKFTIVFRAVSVGTAAAVQPDGKIIFTGWGSTGVSDPEAYFNIARLHAGVVAPRIAAEPFDYDGDGKADLSFFRPSTNAWHTIQSASSQTTEQGFGLSGDTPAPADYDGDGKFDLGVFRPATGDWWFKSSITGVFNTAHFGASGDIPRPSDFDGDGKADFIVYRPTDNIWYRLGTTGAVSITAFGLAGDKPLTGDFDADGKSDLAIYRPSSGEWWWLGSDGNILGTMRWGVASDLPVPADYDGDNKTDFAVYRPSNGTWYIYNSSNNSSTITNFGIAEDKPAAADFDGDGKADIAVFRPSTGVWYLQRSTAGFAAQQFGASTDIPTENAFVP
jgi:uncharacterized delta-60 repeat protein